MTDGEGTLDDVYFEWLYGLVFSVRNRNPSRSYWHLCRQLYTKEFTWTVRNDDNRVEDAKEMRMRFLDESGFRLGHVEEEWLSLGISMFEMLVALSERVAFQADGSIAEWFMRFLYNLEIDRYSDALYEISIQEEVEEALDRVIRRTYAPDGTGGLFPLRHSEHDQRRVELWHQMSAYLMEETYLANRPRW